jgi:hypothetical protein
MTFCIITTGIPVRPITILYLLRQKKKSKIENKLKRTGTVTSTQLTFNMKFHHGKDDFILVYFIRPYC